MPATNTPLPADAELAPEGDFDQDGDHDTLLNLDVRVIAPTALRATRDCLTVGGSAARADRHRTMNARRELTSAEVQRASAAAAG